MEQLLNLQHLLQHEIDDLYSAEEQIIEALPAMVKNAHDPALKKALNEHLRITQEQKKRLDKVQQLLKKESREEADANKTFLDRLFGGSSKCKGMEGLISEGEKMMKGDMEPQVRDAAIIASAQKIEHYEISGYGTARAFANQVGLNEVERLLQTTLNEEYKADDLLSALAMKKVNVKAERGGTSTTESQGNRKRPAGTPVKKAAAGNTKRPTPKKSGPKKGGNKKASAR